MKTLVVGLLGVVLVSTSARGQVGIQTACYGFDGTPELACVGERVTCLSRFVNDSANGEEWSADSLTLSVQHPSGDEASGELLAVPVPVPAGSGEMSFAEGAFVFTARPEDVPHVTGRATAAAFRTLDGPASGHFTGSFANQVFVQVCDQPTLQAHREAFFAQAQLARCMPNAEFSRRVCRTATQTFVAPLP